MRGVIRAPGFSLIELMVVVAVTAILLAVAVPSFNTLLINNRSAAQANAFVDSLNYARAEAVKRPQSQPVYVSTADGGANWQVGWQVWVDANNNGLYDGSSELLKLYAKLSGATTLVSTTPTGLTDVIFINTGAARAKVGTTGNTSASFTFHYSPGSSFCRDVIIKNTGLIFIPTAGVACP